MAVARSRALPCASAAGVAGLQIAQPGREHGDRVVRLLPLAHAGVISGQKIGMQLGALDGPRAGEQRIDQAIFELGDVAEFVRADRRDRHVGIGRLRQQPAQEAAAEQHGAVGMAESARRGRIGVLGGAVVVVGKSRQHVERVGQARQRLRQRVIELAVARSAISGRFGPARVRTCRAPGTARPDRRPARSRRAPMRARSHSRSRW